MPIAVKRRKLRPRTVLLIIFTPIILLISYIVVMTYVVSPIQDSYAKLRFDELNTQMKRVYKEVQATAGDKDVSNYETKCMANVYNSWDGYTCVMKASVVILTPAVNITSLHEKYYPILNTASFVEPIEAISKSYKPNVPTDVVNSIYRRYSSSIDKTIQCSYFINASTLDEIDGFYYNPSPFKGLEGNMEVVKLEIECQIYSNQDWYSKVH